MCRIGFKMILILLIITTIACKKSDSTPPPSPPPTPNPAPTTENRFDIDSLPVTVNATTEAKNLYQFLRNNYGKKILSGVMTLASFDEVNWLKANTGKEPAIVGLDFMHCNRGYNWYNNDEPSNDAKTYWDKKGIPVFVWHWRDPSRTTEEFYSNKTSFDISKVFDTASAEYKAMISDIDFVSGKLKTLQDQHVPVIWRPLHEAAGGWFWWGAKGAAPCKKLYQLMYDRMVNHHGLKNLLWVWTREPGDQLWYPGDEFVDIIGRDIYKQGDHSSQITEFNTLNALYNKKKMIAISECGSMPDADNLLKDKAAWSWYMPWYGDFTRNSTHNSLDLWKKMFASEYVITLDEMPSLK
ncbi:MAG: glycosyl hydrolase [Chitinophagaceae bacterium]